MKTWMVVVTFLLLFQSGLYFVYSQNRIDKQEHRIFKQEQVLYGVIEAMGQRTKDFEELCEQQQGWQIVRHMRLVQEIKAILGDKK